MSDAKKCDVCGAYYGEHVGYEVRSRGHETFGLLVPRDVCSDGCMRKKFGDVPIAPAILGKRIRVTSLNPLVFEYLDAAL
jgi:hypothetical protein